MQDAPHMCTVPILAGGGKHPDDSYCVQVQKVWRTLILHFLMPSCRVPEYPQSKFGLNDNDDDYATWFRNTHHAGMVRQLMYHRLEAWDNCLPQFEGLTSPTEKERVMLNYEEIFRPLSSALSAEVDHQNYYGLFTFKLSGNPILCPTEPNQCSAVVDKRIGGATEQMHNQSNYTCTL